MNNDTREIFLHEVAILKKDLVEFSCCRGWRLHSRPEPVPRASCGGDKSRRPINRRNTPGISSAPRDPGNYGAVDGTVTSLINLSELMPRKGSKAKSFLSLSSLFLLTSVIIYASSCKSWWLLLVHTTCSSRIQIDLFLLPYIELYLIS